MFGKGFHEVNSGEGGTNAARGEAAGIDKIGLITKAIEEGTGYSLARLRRRRNADETL